MNKADYLRAVRPSLPPEAFRPNPWAFVPISIHLAIIVAGWIATHHVAAAWWPLIGLVVGNSMSALAFLAHDVTHRSVTTSKLLLYPTELLLWGLIMLPASLWRRVHGTHHAHTNAQDDPERRFLASELSPIGLVAAATLYPNRTLRYNVLCLFNWITFPLRHAVALLFPGRTKPDFVTAKPRYSRAEKARIGFEFLFIAAMQVGIAYLTEGAYLWVAILPVFITSAVVSCYFFTNHGLKPVDDGRDVLAASTTVLVPALLNLLHSNASYHTEHHLFPTMNPKYYPLVSAQFRARFPERYHAIPIGHAWSALWRNAIAAERRERPGQTAEQRSEPSAATFA
jgi:fatty acid desaturase